MKHKLLYIYIVLLLSLTHLYGANSTVAGLPDTTYGTNGVVQIPFAQAFTVNRLLPFSLFPEGASFSNDYFMPAVKGFIDMNQRMTLIMTAQGLFAAIRLLADGSLDQTFGTNGQVALYIPRSQENYPPVSPFFDPNFPSDPNYAWASSQSVVVDIQGKVTIAGYVVHDNKYTTNMLLARYTYDGVLDPTFGTNGIVEIQPPVLGVGYWVEQIIFDYAGRYIVVGTQAEYESNNGGAFVTLKNKKFLVARFLQDGSVDTTFADKGFFIYTISNTLNSILRSIVTDNFNNYVVTGVAQGTIPGNNNLYGSSQMISLRLTENGVIDQTFGKKGVLATQVTPPGPRPFSNIGGYKIIQDAETNLVVAGGGASLNTIFADEDQYPLIVRYAAYAYNLDPSFGKNGQVKMFDLENVRVYSNDALTDLNNKIISVSFWWAFYFSRYTIFRLLSNGSIDTTYGGNGTGMHSVIPGGELGVLVTQPSLQLDASGRLYVCYWKWVLSFPMVLYYVVDRYTSDYTDIFSGYGISISTGYGTGV